MSIQRTIQNWLLRNLFKATVLEDILTIHKGVTGQIEYVLLRGKPLTDLERRNLLAEAQLLKGMRLWKIISETLEEDAKDKIFNKSKNWEEMFFGKAMLYNQSIQRNIIDLFNVDRTR